MRVIEGKQAVLRPYLTEAQCVRPVAWQDVETVAPREYPVQDAIIQPLRTGQSAAADATVTLSRPASVCKVHAVVDSGRVLNATAKEELTIAQLFTQA